MNRKDRRHPSKAAQMKQLLNDISAVQKFKDAIEGEWPIKEGDKVRLNIDAIKNHPDYKQRLPAYRTFCEKNAGRVFTVEYHKGLRQSVVCFAEDTTFPKWLFWIGDLMKV